MEVTKAQFLCRMTLILECYDKDILTATEFKDKMRKLFDFHDNNSGMEEPAEDNLTVSFQNDPGYFRSHQQIYK